MKKQMIMSVIAVAVMSVGVCAQASVSSQVGTWVGTGASYTLEGDKLGTYQVGLVNTLESDGSVASAVTVTLQDGTVKNFEQILQDSSKGFTITSDEGTGGGICVGEGLCEGYFGDSKGNGMAMTIVIDGSDSFRILKTELRNFEANHLYREKYVRSQSK